MEKARVVIQLCYENKFYLNSLNTNSLSENDKFVIHLSSYAVQSDPDVELDESEEEADSDDSELSWDLF
tara:strand:+ start:70 stop:276 length:207 start_codon:yes stop_codon:yes gene_type:complete